MMEETCFAWKDGRCLALTAADCTGCRFYKTPERFRADRAAALRRLRGLSDRAQWRIAESYYKGVLPEVSG